MGKRPRPGIVDRILFFSAAQAVAQIQHACLATVRDEVVQLALHSGHRQEKGQGEIADVKSFPLSNSAVRKARRRERGWGPDRRHELSRRALGGS